LLDRIEVIEFSGYLEEEKLEIGRQFIVPRQFEEHGLSQTRLRFEEDALKTIIRLYTREAGVRNMEREVANVCRKIARAVAEGKSSPRRITSKRIIDLLGPPRFSLDILQEIDEVGIATGAAWTAAGGEILFIEVNLMPGKGGMTLTGQLGDVMQESAQAALTFTRSQSEALSIKPDQFDKMDIHVHLPEGAVPKDGPSAGVSMATALISAFTNRPIRRDVSMTGEITLRGRVLPVGGIREKALAARRAGIKTFILPKKNESDLQEIPKKLRQDMKFVLVERMGEVLEAALLPGREMLPQLVEKKQRRGKTAVLPTVPPPGVPPA
jgi:ATP-dependent Lon protease